MKTKFVFSLIFTAAVISGCIPPPDHIVNSHDLAEQARLAFKQDNLPRAQKLYLQAELEARQSGSPLQLPHVLSALAQVYAQEGDAKNAQACFEQSLTIYNGLLANKPEPEDVKSLTERKVETLVAMGNFFRDRSWWAEAEKTYQQALETSQQLQRFKYDAVSVEYENMLRKKGEPQKAIALARSTLQRTGEIERWSPDFQRAIKNYTYYTGRPDNQREAVRVLDRLHAFALRLGPSDPRLPHSYDFLVTRQRVDGHFGEAEKTCLTAIKLSDKNPSTAPLSTKLSLRGQLANIYEHQGRLPEALVVVNQAIALAQPIVAQPQLMRPPYPPTIASLYAEQAIVLEKLKKPQEALVAQQSEDNIRVQYQEWRHILASAQTLYAENRPREHMYEVALRRATDKGNRQGMGCIRSTWGSYLFYSQHGQQAEKLLTESLDDLKGVDQARFCLVRSFLLLAVINKQRHQSEQAERYYQQAFAAMGKDRWSGNLELKTLINLYHSM